jgi:carbonic anhydrase
VSALVCAWPAPARAAEPAAKVKEEVKKGLDKADVAKRNLQLVVMDKSKYPASGVGALPVTRAGVGLGTASDAVPVPAVSARAAKEPALQARAKAAVMAQSAHPESHGHAAHWSYGGEHGPSHWGNLQPSYATCATGKRQSPIHIEDHNTLQGPAEPIQINYQPSNATVVNNGHTIQVNVSGNNSITVRGTAYQLLQFHFHHPSEEQINSRRFTMVAHLVHQSAQGQLAVIAVLLGAGQANALIHQVWTYMPLDHGDKVNMPPGLLNLSELLPKDQRYYQFLGSLTTPPCSENVLWMVLKEPMTLSPEQIRLFAQMFPNNARPVQPLHGRVVRNAQ